MAVPHRLSSADARRVAVGAQLLGAPRPTDLVETVRRLTLLQLDPTAAIAPNVDLVAWSRLGAAYAPEHLQEALRTRRLLEWASTVRPAEDIALHRAEMAAWRGQGRLGPWVEANEAARTEVLAQLEAGGPLASRDLHVGFAEPWTSSGWTNDRSLVKLLEIMVARGEVAIAGRSGRERLWDLADRVYPDLPALPLEEARRARDERRLRSLGIARARRTQVPVEPWSVGDAGEAATVEGTEGEWRVDPAALEREHAPRTALLSPFDRLVHDRVRAEELFGFTYVLEMYKPAAQRRWGYFALPVLHGDALVGKLDARADRRAGVLRVDAVHEDVPFDADRRDAVRAEVEALAAWLGLEHPG